MKFKTLLLFVSLILIQQLSFSQETYAGMRFGIQYGLPKRPAYDSYLQQVTDTLRLTTNLVTNPAYGVNAAFVVHAEHGEFEFGGDIDFASKTVLIDSTDGFVKVKARNFGIVTGGSYFPAKWFFMGGDFIINSFSGDIKSESLPASVATSIENVDASSNIFRGYSVMARATAGFSLGMVRLSAYYDIGSKFNFITSSDHRLKNYQGSQKTGYSLLGFTMQFVLKRED